MPHNRHQRGATRRSHLNPTTLTTVVKIGRILVVLATIVGGFAAALPVYQYFAQRVFCFNVRTEPLNKSADMAKQEVLILVADFNQAGEPIVEDPSNNLYISLEQELEKVSSPGFKTRIEHIVSPRILDEATAEATSDCRKATIIVWGQTREIDVRYVFYYRPRWDVELEDPYSEAYDTLLTARDRPKDFAVQGGGGGKFLVDFVLADLYWLKDQESQALMYLDGAITYSASFPQVPSSALKIAYELRGEIYTNRGEAELALSSYDKAIQLDDAYALAYHDRGVVETTQRKVDQAIADFNRAIEIDPRFARAYANRALLEAETHKTTEAMADFSKAIRLEPSDYYLYLIRGSTEMNFLGRPDSALDDFDKALALNPSSVIALNQRAMLYHSQHELEKARADLLKAEKLISQDRSGANAIILSNLGLNKSR